MGAPADAACIAAVDAARGASDEWVLMFIRGVLAPECPGKSFKPRTAPTWRNARARQHRPCKQAMQASAGDEADDDDWRASPPAVAVDAFTRTKRSLCSAQGRHQRRRSPTSCAPGLAGPLRLLRCTPRKQGDTLMRQVAGMAVLCAPLN